MDEKTPHITRILSLEDLLRHKSRFLLGPRQTGKTSLVLKDLKSVRLYDMLDTTVYLNLSRNPGGIEE